jgi:hypothetical protein
MSISKPARKIQSLPSLELMRVVAMIDKTPTSMVILKAGRRDTGALLNSFII